MKKITTFLMMCALSLSVMAQGYAVITDTVEHDAPAIGNTTIDLTVPCSRMTLLATHAASSATTNKTILGNLKVEQYVNKKWEEIYNDCPGVVTEAERGTFIKTKYEAAVDYEALTLNLNIRATQIRFSNTQGLTAKTYKDVNIYMASFVEVTPAKLDFGEIEVFSESVSKSFFVEHCNVARLSMTSSNADFALNTTIVTNSGIAQYKTDTFTVTFTPNIRGQHTATIVVTNGTQTDSIHCYAKVTKKNPVLTWNVPETIMVGDVVSDPVSSTCTNDFALISCSENVQIVCGEIRALAEGVATIEVMQLGDDDYWNNKIQEFTVTVEPKPEIPTLTAPVSDTQKAERYVRNGQVYVRVSETEFTIDGKKN